MINTGILLGALLLLSGVVVGLAMLPSGARRKALAGLGVLVVVLIGWDLSNYRIIHKRRNALLSEYSAGMSVAQATSWLEENKKRLHVSGWRFDQNGKDFFIFLDAPFSLTAMLREYEGAWYFLASVDPERKRLQALR
jgi:hypothetical protein